MCNTARLGKVAILVSLLHFFDEVRYYIAFGGSFLRLGCGQRFQRFNQFFDLLALAAQRLLLCQIRNFLVLCSEVFKLAF